VPALLSREYLATQHCMKEALTALDDQLNASGRLIILRIDDSEPLDLSGTFYVPTAIDTRPLAPAASAPPRRRARVDRAAGQTRARDLRKRSHRALPPAGGSVT
jgi:hypothetical protein